MKPSFTSLFFATMFALLPNAVAIADQVDVTSDAADNASPSLEISDAQVSLIQNAFIAAPMAGVVARVNASEGDHVEKGTVLVVLDDTQAQTELQAAEAAFDAAHLASANDVDQRYAQRTLEVRERELQQSQIANANFPGTISATELEKLRLVVDQSRLAIEQAQHELQVARAHAAEKKAAVQISLERLRKHEIRTTVAGMITQVDVEPGEWVEAGKPIVRVISLDPIRVECFVDGRKHAMDLVGKPVRFLPTFSDHEPDHAVDPDADKADKAPAEFHGKVTFVSPELHPVTGQVRLWATIANPDALIRAGMRGQLIVAPK
ncbi:MAG: HlyD family efflux transporter periplasmic adaptor subunit [Pirellulaceae bacterium]|nr:HlyD family efflux transporter periplasmic adaptor subunit [Pirellulaceae bacterium]